MRARITLAFTAFAAVVANMPVEAQGHGPVYGLSTPARGRGGWSLDVAGMGRFIDGARMTMIRPMISFGVTEDLQVSASVPVPLILPRWRLP